MGRQIIAAVLLSVLCLAAAGCNGARETDEIAYVLLMGIDRNHDGQLEYTLQFAVPRSFGAGSSSAPKDITEASEVLTVKAATLAEARDLANSTVARILHLAHVKGIIVGEKIAREGIDANLPPLTRFREYRGSMFLMVVHNGTAREFIEKNQPKLEVSPNRYIETMMASSGESSSYLPTNIHDYYCRLKNGGGEPYLTLVGSLTERGQPAPKKEHSIDKTGGYAAGEIPRPSPENPTEFLGTAIFTGDKMSGVLDNKQTRGLALVEGKFGRGFLSLADPLAPGKTVNLEIEQGRKPKIEASIVDGQAKFFIDIFIEAEITAITSGVYYEGGDYRERLERQVSTAIQQNIREMLDVTQPLGSDAAGLSCRLWPGFSRYQELSRVDWPAMYRNADITVKVVTKIRRSGFIIKTSSDHLNRREE